MRYSFTDAAGATLSDDRAWTGGDGSASVTLTAGATEASFQVSASADGAAVLVFDIAVSRFPFVSVDARLVYGGPGFVKQVNHGLAALLARDGFRSMGEAVGADHRQVAAPGGSTPDAAGTR